MRATASACEIRPSFAISTAMRSAARAVRLPLRVCSIQSLPRSIGEFDVLHVAIMLFEQLRRSRRIRANASGISVFQRRRVGAGRLARRLGDVLRRANARHDVLALGVDEELAVEFIGAGRGIAGEGDAGRRGLAHIAEHHRLDADRGAPALGDVVEAPVGDGARVHPRSEHGADRAPELLDADPAGKACRSPRRPAA